jgi:DNA-binding response OmpR family regulator
MIESPALIVEDDLFLADIFNTTLRLAGFQTEIFNDGISALARLAQVTPALVVLDLNLPGTPGIQILSQIRRDKRLAHTPVLVATANTAQASFLDAGTDDNLFIMLKPIAIGDLLQFARRMKARKNDTAPLTPLPEAFIEPVEESKRAET